jgi:hypothetical protein
MHHGQPARGHQPDEDHAAKYEKVDSRERGQAGQRAERRRLAESKRTGCAVASIQIDPRRGQDE